MNIALFIALITFIFVGWGFDIAGINRKKKTFDKRCNMYFIVSVGCFFMVMILAIVELLIIIF